MTSFQHWLTEMCKVKFISRAQIYTRSCCISAGWFNLKPYLVVNINNRNHTDCYPQGVNSHKKNKQTFSHINTHRKGQKISQRLVFLCPDWTAEIVNLFVRCAVPPAVSFPVFMCVDAWVTMNISLCCKRSCCSTRTQHKNTMYETAPTFLWHIHPI